MDRKQWLTEAGRQLRFLRESTPNGIVRDNQILRSMRETEREIVTQLGRILVEEYFQDEGAYDPDHVF